MPTRNRSTASTIRALACAAPLCLIAGILHGQAPAEPIPFLRGDANVDGRLSISDSLTIRRWLFGAEDVMPCLAAGDFNEDRFIDILDSLELFSTLFLGEAGEPDYPPQLELFFHFLSFPQKPSAPLPPPPPVPPDDQPPPDECEEQCVKSAESSYAFCLRSDTPEEVCAARNRERLQDCRRRCERDPTPDYPSCADRCHDLKVHVVESCKRNGGDPAECMRRAEREVAGCLENCGGNSPGHCDQRCDFIFRETRAACLEGGDDLEDCEDRAEEARAGCRSGCDEPTGDRCRSNCAVQATAALGRCLLQGNELPDCETHAGELLSGCVDRCGGDRKGRCESRCDSEGKNARSRCLQGGGSWDDCLALEQDVRVQCKAACGDVGEIDARSEFEFPCDSYDVEPPGHSDDIVRFGDVEATAGRQIAVPVHVESAKSIDAVQLVISYDPELFTPVEHLSVFTDEADEDVRRSVYLGTLYEGCSRRPGCGFELLHVRAHAAEGILTVGFIPNLFFPGSAIPPRAELPLFNIVGTVRSELGQGAVLELAPFDATFDGESGDGFGEFGLRNELSYRGEARFLTIQPKLEPRIFNIIPDISIFNRGDSNDDGEVTVSDSLANLFHLFVDADTVDCEDAADVNDDGTLDLTDTVNLLEYLFLDGFIIPAPFGAAGEDPTPDALECEVDYFSSP